MSTAQKPTPERAPAGEDAKRAPAPHDLPALLKADDDPDDELGNDELGNDELGNDEFGNKPAEELTPEELRLMADTTPGDGPGGD
ncbi:MAG: hypothetical protein ACLGI6_19815 [Gammaproteobacteria bacterium]